MKNTNKALFSSVVALILCCTMLVGSTFAWFTDSASSAVNTIQAGNLDIVLEYSTDNGNTWNNAEGETLNFIAADNRTDILWEPGCTYELPAIRVRNNGNLALQYTIVINGVTGSAKLLEAIEFTANGNPLDTFSGHLDTTGATSESIVIQGHMKEEAGNEYQGLKIEGIGITVYANQAPVESDSFGSNYDANANVFNVTTTEEAQAALDAAEDGAIINFVAGNTYGMLYFRQSEASEIVYDRDYSAGVYDEVKLRTIKNLTINGNGATIEGFATEAYTYHNGDVWHSNEAAYPILESFIVLENVKIDNVAFTGNSDAISVTGKTSVDGLSVTNCTMHHAVNANNKTFLVAQPNVDAVVGNVNGEAFEIQFANVTVDNCKASYVDRFILAFHSENLTVTNNTVSNVDQHFINLQAGLTDHTGVITITDNSYTNGSERFIRAAFLADAHLVLERNTVNNAFYNKTPAADGLDLVKVNVRAGSEFTFTNYDNQIHTTENANATFDPTIA